MRIIIILVMLLCAVSNLWAATFSLASVSSRTIAPYEDEQFSRVKFTVTNPNFSEINASIFDLAGREIFPALPRQSGYDNVFYWNGRDSSGVVVPSGVYIYQLEGDGVVINGSVVVVR